jgi:2'-5' RNA ligase
MSATKTDTLRLFFALWPDDATRAALAQLQAPIRGRITPYEHLHLTLAFLGHQPVSLLPVLKDILLHLESPATDLVIDRVGYFMRNRIAWAGTHETPRLLQLLYRELTEALINKAIAFDSHNPFKPHITLVRDAIQPPDLAFAPIRWHANRVVLVSSSPRVEGNHYEVIASRSLDDRLRTPDMPGVGSPDRPD